VLIAHGKAWLHSNLNYKWSLSPKYDPKDTKIENHLINLVGYSGGDQMAVSEDFCVIIPCDVCYTHASIYASI